MRVIVLMLMLMVKLLLIMRLSECAAEDADCDAPFFFFFQHAMLMLMYFSQPVPTDCCCFPRLPLLVTTACPPRLLLHRIKLLEMHEFVGNSRLCWKFKIFMEIQDFDHPK